MAPRSRLGRPSTRSRRGRGARNGSSSRTGGGFDPRRWGWRRLPGVGSRRSPWTESGSPRGRPTGRRVRVGGPSFRVSGRGGIRPSPSRIRGAQRGTVRPSRVRSLGGRAKIAPRHRTGIAQRSQRGKRLGSRERGWWPRSRSSKGTTASRPLFTQGIPSSGDGIPRVPSCVFPLPRTGPLLSPASTGGCPPRPRRRRSRPEPTSWSWSGSRGGSGRAAAGRAGTVLGGEVRRPPERAEETPSGEGSRSGVESRRPCTGRDE